MNQQQQKRGRSRFRRFFRWLGLGVLLLIVVLLVGVHLPFVQDMIAVRGTRYLSKKTGGEFAIEKLRFSILGNISLEGFVVNEPDGDTLGRVNSLEFHTHILGLLRKDIVLNDLLLDGVALELRQSGDDMNLDFIINAFSQSDTTESGPPSHLYISSNSLCLRNVDFSFTQDKNVLHVLCGDLCLNGSTLSIAPNEILVDSMGISNTSVDYTGTADIAASAPPVQVTTLPPLDLGSGFEIMIGSISIDSSGIMYRQGERLAGDKFDPRFIILDRLHVQAENFTAGDEALGLQLVQLSTGLDDKPVDSISFAALFEPQTSEISDFYLEAGRSRLGAAINLNYEEWSALPTQIESASGRLEFGGLMAKSDLEYLLPDSIIDLISEWTDISVESQIEHKQSTTNIEQLSVVTGASQINTSVELSDLTEPSEMAWNNARLNAEVGSEFASTIRYFSNEIRIPPDLSLDMRSDGSIGSFDLEANVLSTWGSLTSTGNFGYDDARFKFDSDVSGTRIALDSILSLEWADSCDVEVSVQGETGDNLVVEVNGKIIKAGLMDQAIQDIQLNGRYTPDSLKAEIESRDPFYPMRASVAIALSDTLDIRALVSSDSFALGRLSSGDTSLYTSADMDLSMRYSPGLLSGALAVDNMAVVDNRNTYESDSLALQFLSTGDSSRILIVGDDLYGTIESNFDLRHLPALIDSNISRTMLIDPDLYTSGYAFDAKLDLLNSALLDFVNFDTETFSSLSLRSRLDPGAEQMTIDLSSGELKSNEVSIDTLNLAMETDASGVSLSTVVENIVYDSIVVGTLFWDAVRQAKGIHNSLRLVKDSTENAGLRAIVRRDGRNVLIQFDSLVVLGDVIDVSSNRPVVVSDTNVYFDNFEIRDRDTEVKLDGDLEQFVLEVEDLPLVNMDRIFMDNEDLISRGVLNASVAVDARDRKFDGTLTIDSIQFYSTPPLNVVMNTSSLEDRIPFDILIENDVNTIKAEGAYLLSNNEIEANANLNVRELQTFEFLTEDILEKMEGSLTGDVRLSGPIAAPVAEGQLRFVDTDIIVLQPRSEFRIEDDVMTFTEKGINLNSFTLKDVNGTPLILNGQLITEDYRNFNYDLNVKTDNYVLIDEPRSTERSLSGVFAFGADIDVTGSLNTLKLDANFRVSDSTDITYVMPQEGVELITGAGIVEFVDPTLPEDSLTRNESLSYLDSVLANLPTLDLNSSLRITDNSNFKVVIDKRSGDYVEARGKANVQVSMDRTGNIRMNGSYEIVDGTYQLSFYDLVQKKFKLANESRIQWDGAPDQGSIDITARYTTQTSSVGLIGDEVSENETYLYRRALPYTVSIVIKGTLDEPQVSFELDLPQKYRMEYPVLDNKLSRLEQPEYESERNKQVFGLLVLGGFIPESRDEFDEMAVATTAIANSVNSLLAAQLNRLTNKIKGVDINIGLQSYSDFQSGAGMRTAVDFRVSKRLADDRLSIEVGGEMDVGAGQSNYAYSDGFRGDVTVIYDLTKSGNTKLKAFNNETYDIIYHEIRNTGIALIFVREFNKGDGILPKKKKKQKE